MKYFGFVDRIIVRSDSQIVDTMTQGWSRKSNGDLWSKLDTVLRGMTVDFEKVIGHSSSAVSEDVRRNNEADRLAVEAKSLSDLLEDEGYQGPVFVPEHHEKPTVNAIELRHPDGDAKEREALCKLSNGTVITIRGYQGGFTQSGGTNPEFAVTLPYALRLACWLNGGPF